MYIKYLCIRTADPGNRSDIYAVSIRVYIFVPKFSIKIQLKNVLVIALKHVDTPK